MRRNLGGCLWASVWENGFSAISIAAFLFSLATLAVRFLEEGGQAIPAIEIAAIPSAICWVVLTAILVSSGANLLHKSKTVRLLTILRGLFGAASLVLVSAWLPRVPVRAAATQPSCGPPCSTAHSALCALHCSTMSALSCYLLKTQSRSSSAVR